MMRSMAILSFLTALVCGMQSNTIQFVGESVDIELKQASILISGIYHFRNSSPEPVNSRIFYPLPVDENHVFPNAIRVRYGQGKPIQFTAHPRGISFAAHFPPDSSIAIEIGYRQQTPNHSMRYILTSTAGWGSALKWGHYSVWHDSAYAIDTSSLDFDTTFTVVKRVFHTAFRTNFMPTEDIQIKWGQR